MAESFAQIEARRKREAAARAARPNTGKSQGVGGVLSSLLPGGQKANLGGLGQSAKNFAGEVSGVYDIGRGVKELQKGNIAGGLGRIALGAVGFVPGVGAVSKGVTAAAKAAKATKFVTAATRSKPVTALAASRPVTAVRPAVTTLGRPVVAANRGLQNIATRAYTPLYAAKTPIGRVAATALTSPAVLAGIGLSTVGALTAPGAAGYTTRQPGTTPRGQGGLSLGINVPAAGGTGGTGSLPGTGGGTGPGTGPGGAGGTGGVGEDGKIGGESAILEETVPVVETPTPEVEKVTPVFTTSGDVAAKPGVPGEVQVAEADYIANLAANAAASYGRQAGIREALAQGIEGVQGSAADIIGGRSQAILGQGITGQRRQYQTGVAREVQQQTAEKEASRRAYTEAVRQAYEKQAQEVLNRAQFRAEQAAQIKRIG